MKHVLIVFFLFLANSVAANADDNDAVSQIKAMLNPQSRFRVREVQSNELSCTYSESKGIKSFGIDNLVTQHRLVISIDASGQAKAQLVPSSAKASSQTGVPVKVYSNLAKFDKTDQSLEGRLEGNQKTPKSMVFGIYWDMGPYGAGADSVDYTIAYRTEKNETITVITCHHDLRGTALEAPWQAAADAAAGALLANFATLKRMTYGLAIASTQAQGNPTRNEITPLQRSFQQSLDFAVVQIDELAHYTQRANPIVASKVMVALEPEQSRRLAAALRRLRDPKTTETEAVSANRILEVWATDGIPFSVPGAVKTSAQ